jgi:transketolase
LTALQTVLPELVGGSADLAGSTGVATGAPTVQRGQFDGRDIAFGVREFAMAAALNGMSLHGGFRVFGSTFAVFSDYLRPAVRLSALMGQPVVYVLSHDSVAVGEDGPTHQPVEHIEALRLIPEARVFRPADDEETVLAWQLALEHRSGPSLLLLSRQALPALTDLAPGEDPRVRTVYRDDCARPDVEFLATGSEAQLAISAAARLHEHGLTCRVLSVVEREALVGRERQAALTVSVEAGVTSGWHRFADLCIGVDTFGQSGAAEDVLRAVGLHVEAIVDRVHEARAARNP